MIVLMICYCWFDIDSALQCSGIAIGTEYVEYFRLNLNWIPSSTNTIYTYHTSYLTGCTQFPSLFHHNKSLVARLVRAMTALLMVRRVINNVICKLVLRIGASIPLVIGCPIRCQVHSTEAHEADLSNNCPMPFIPPDLQCNITSSTQLQFYFFPHFSLN